MINADDPTASIERTTVNRLVLVITFLLIFIMAARTPLDTDMWWHLRAGEEMLRTGQVLQTDIFSFTRAGAHWMNVFWLADLGMALLFRWGGFLAISAAVAVAATLSMLLVLLQSEGPAFIKSAVLLLGSMVCSLVWSPRPQVLSLVLVALTGYLLYLYKWRGIDRLWALPLVFILWSNVHGSFMIGLIQIGAVVAGEILNHLFNIQTDNRLPWRKIIRLGVFGLVCGLVVLINPTGLDVWKLPIYTANMRATVQLIPEWASPDFHQLLQQSMLWLLLAAVASIGLAGRMMDGADLITLIGFTYLALLARRSFGVSAIVILPVLLRSISVALTTWPERAPWTRRWLASAPKQAAPGRFLALKKAVNLSLVSLLMLAALGKLYIVSYPALVNYYEAQSFPSQATAWLADHAPGVRIFNEYNWGGYLLWKLEKNRLFVDGRADLYGDALLEEWSATSQASPGWQDTLTRYQVDLVMLAPDRPLLKAVDAAGWKLVYQDQQAVIYAKP
jgi:hypothetical protein